MYNAVRTHIHRVSATHLVSQLVVVGGVAVEVLLVVVLAELVHQGGGRVGVLPFLVGAALRVCGGACDTCNKRSSRGQSRVARGRVHGTCLA